MYRTGHHDNHESVAVTNLTKATFQQILDLIVITSVKVVLDLSQRFSTTSHVDYDGP